MLKNIKKISIVLLAILVVFGFTFTANAVELPDRPDDFPEDEIMLVTPTAPGGSYDLLARGIARFAPEYAGVDFVVNNMPGANMGIGAEYIVNAEPDGYTLGVSADTPWIWANLEYNFDFDATEDVDYIAVASETARAWTIYPGLDFDNLGEVMEYAKENPNELSIATASTTTNVEAQLLREAGYKFNLIPYGSAGEAVADVAGGHVDLGSNTFTGSWALIESGDIDLLAYDGDKEGYSYDEDMPHIDDYPEIAEIIAPVPNTRTAVQAPVGVPEDRIEFIEAVMLKTFQSEEFQEYAVDVGLNPAPIGREEYTESMIELYRLAEELLADIDI